MLPTSIPSNLQKQLQAGDHIKVEFKNAISGESEWMWILVDFDDRASGLVFGWLDNEPALYHGQNLTLGLRVAVAHHSIRGFRTSVSPSDDKRAPASTAAPDTYANAEE